MIKRGNKRKAGGTLWLGLFSRKAIPQPNGLLRPGRAGEGRKLSFESMCLLPSVPWKLKPVNVIFDNSQWGDQNLCWRIPKSRARRKNSHWQDLLSGRMFPHWATPGCYQWHPSLTAGPELEFFPTATNVAPGPLNHPMPGWLSGKVYTCNPTK